MTRRPTSPLWLARCPATPAKANKKTTRKPEEVKTVRVGQRIAKLFNLPRAGRWVASAPCRRTPTASAGWPDLGGGEAMTAQQLSVIIASAIARLRGFGIAGAERPDGA